MTFLKFLASYAIQDGSICSWLAILCLCAAVASLFIKRLRPHCFDLIAVGWLLAFLELPYGGMGAMSVIGLSDTTPPAAMVEAWWIISLARLLPVAVLTVPAVLVLCHVQPQFRLADHRWAIVAVCVCFVDWVILLCCLMNFLCSNPYRFVG